MRVRLLVYTAAAILATAFLLWYSVRGTDWGRVAQLVLGVRWPYIAVTSTIITTVLFLRALRWRILLRAEAPVPAGAVFWATSAGYLGNCFLPARAGELVRTQMMSTRSGICRSYVLATVLAERIADAGTLVIVSAMVLFALKVKPAWLAGAAEPFAALAATGVLAIAMLPWLDRFGKRLIAGLPVAAVLREKLAGILDGGLRGLRAFHDANRLIRFLALTALIWSLEAASAICCAAALGIALPVPVAFLLIAGLGLGSALPSAPGYIGIYQFVAVSVLTPFGIGNTAAIAYILCAQALNYVVVACWGSLGLLWRWNASRIQTEPSSNRTGAATVGGLGGINAA